MNGRVESPGVPILALWQELRLLVVLTAAYLLGGGLFLAAVGADPFEVLKGFRHSFASFLGLLDLLVPWWAVVAVALPCLAIRELRQHLARRLPQLIVAIMLCSAFTLMFGLVKNRLTLVWPFWADGVLSQLDLALHFGYSPRDLLVWLGALPTNRLLVFYLNSWVFLATFLPALLLVFDPDRERRRVFILLWALCWVGLGNALALAGLSYGPIFSDLFNEGVAADHQGALALLVREDAQALLATKMHLWRAYTGESPMLGSGISAFPSVHVGMAMVLGLYLAQLMRGLGRRLETGQGGGWRRWPGIAFALRNPGGLGAALAVLYVGAYLLLSVYLGWHYAVDGYVSILLIGAAYLVLARRRT